jgi:hypothetical protein
LVESKEIEILESDNAKIAGEDIADRIFDAKGTTHH